MKKFLLILLALTMLAGSLTLTSCGSKPDLDVDDAEDALEDENYSVYTTTREAGIKKQLYARNGDDELTIIVFEDSTLAKLAYEEAKLEQELKEKYYTNRVDFYERMLKKYTNSMLSSEIDDMKDDLKDANDELEYSKNYVVGRSGKTVWYGTKRAIKDSKG